MDIHGLSQNIKYSFRDDFRRLMVGPVRWVLHCIAICRVVEFIYLGRHQTTLSLAVKYGYMAFAITFGILCRARFDGSSTALQFVALNL